MVTIGLLVVILRGLFEDSGLKPMGSGTSQGEFRQWLAFFALAFFITFDAVILSVVPSIIVPMDDIGHLRDVKQGLKGRTIAS